MGLREEVIRCLADGQVHSGSGLATQLAVSRSAVWKHVHQLRSLGLEVVAVPGRGYQLRPALELLEAERILQLLDAQTAAALEALELHDITDSTSARVLQAAMPSAGCLRACLAEFQSSGRGRRGRRWLSPFGAGVCLSIGWCFEAAPQDLPALSLAAGVAVHRALAALGATGLQLKWPNDVIHGGHKLAGILVDVEGESGGPLKAAVGVGMNVVVPPALAAAVARDGGLPPVGLVAALPGGTVSRNEVAAGLIGSLYHALREFSVRGFATFADAWRRHDCLYGRAVTVRSGPHVYSGTACGISPAGALLLERDGEIATIVTGEVSLSAAA